MRSFIVTAALACGFVRAQTPSALPVDIQIPVAPRSFVSMGKVNYVYEIYLTNVDRGGRTLTLSSVQVLGDQGKQLATFSGEPLAKELMQPGLIEGADVRQLGAGRRAVFFVWLAMAESEPRPASLRHRFEITIEGVAGDNHVECCQTAVPRDAPLVIGPPLRGGGWLAGNGPSNSSEHRRALVTVDGRAYLAQRFAIDWIQFGKNGELGLGKGAENRDYFAYGAEVLAVVAGRVCGIKRRNS